MLSRAARANGIGGKAAEKNTAGTLVNDRRSGSCDAPPRHAGSRSAAAIYGPRGPRPAAPESRVSGIAPSRAPERGATLTFRTEPSQRHDMKKQDRALSLHSQQGWGGVGVGGGVWEGVGGTSRDPATAASPPAHFEGRWVCSSGQHKKPHQSAFFFIRQPHLPPSRFELGPPAGVTAPRPRAQACRNFPQRGPGKWPQISGGLTRSFIKSLTPPKPLRVMESNAS